MLSVLSRLYLFGRFRYYILSSSAKRKARDEVATE
jgi:hypothetical protein